MDSGCTRNEITTETKSLGICGVAGPGGGAAQFSCEREVGVFWGRTQSLGVVFQMIVIGNRKKLLHTEDSVERVTGTLKPAPNHLTQQKSNQE